MLSETTADNVTPIVPRAPDENVADTAPAVAEPQNDEPQAEIATPTVQQPGFVLAAYFDFLRSDGTRGSDRVFISGVPNLRYRAQLEHFEKVILDQSQGQLMKVLITNWKQLEG